MIIDRPICPDGRVALTGTSTSPCLAASRPFILAATILASAMGFIDGSVVTIALPSIERDLSAPFETVQWVINGRVAIFTLASAGCALAPGITMLIGTRLVQGIGAALMIPQSLAILRTVAKISESVRLHRGCGVVTQMCWIPGGDFARYARAYDRRASDSAALGSGQLPVR